MGSIRISCLVAGAMAGQVMAQTNTLTRDRDPLVLEGAALESLLGLGVDEIVGFRHQGDWEQIPVQIDERKYVDFGTVYAEPPLELGTVAYTDASTYTGPDTDSAFDDNDELVFMAADAGDRAPTTAGFPPGVLADRAQEVAISDPLDGGMGYVYLFRSDGTLSPGAGADYVTYHFRLLAGEYIPHYSLMAGPNPEDSEAYSAYYRTHFSDRWIRDEASVFGGGSSPDIA